MEDQGNEKKWWWECITSLELRVIALHKLVSLVSAATSQPAPVVVVPQVLQKIRELPNAPDPAVRPQQQAPGRPRVAQEGVLAEPFSEEAALSVDHVHGVAGEVPVQIHGVRDLGGLVEDVKVALRDKGPAKHELRVLQDPLPRHHLGATPSLDAGSCLRPHAAVTAVAGLESP